MPTCDQPAYSRIPTDKVYRAAYTHMVAWIRKGKAPPIAPFIDRKGNELARDANGNTTGGIQVAEHAVPLAMNTGFNAGQARFCRLYGAHIPFANEKVRELYPTHDGYVAKVKAITQHNVEAGFILPADAKKTIATASKRELAK
jgi:hypothetical protein